ncbi:MAG TPA: FtsX-like permease family protein, partial [Eoetvoesiella sp.]
MLNSWFSNIHSGLRALRRDWHSGELRLLMLALVVAVAAVTSVGFLSDRVGRALERNAAQMLGADLVMQSDSPIGQSFFDQARIRQLDVTQTMLFPSMVSSASDSQLISLKAVGDGYPLRGKVKVSDSIVGAGTAISEVPAQGTVWVDAQVLSLLGLKPGDMLSVGEAQMKIARVITYEPDRGVQFINVAPRVMMRIEDLPATELVAPGSRIKYALLVAGADSAVQDYKTWLTGHLQRGQKISTLGGDQPTIQRALDRAHQFLILVALLTVMIAAVAIALSARRFALRHQDGIAIMRCLGAGRSQVGVLLWTEFLSLGIIAATVGTLIGFGVHQGLVSVVAAWFDTALPGPSWRPALQGLIAGLVLLLGFALPPLSALRRVPPVRVLRRESALSVRNGWLAYAVGAAAFFALVLWVSADLRLSIVISGGFSLAFVLFALIGYTGIWALSQLRRYADGRPTLRFALAGIARRKSLTVTQVCALAMGLMILLLLTITRTDLLTGWQNTVPPDAPNTFLINIQPDQQALVQTRLQQAGIGRTELAPMVRGRLVAINGQAVNGQMYAQGRAQRLVDREFNLSYMDDLPASNTIQTGRWLDPNQNEVSLESDLAVTLGIAVGDNLTFDVAGQAIKVMVTSVRDVKWDSFQTNFFAILSPAALKGAPVSYITSFHLPKQSAGLAQQLVHEFPNLTVFDVGSILSQVQAILDQVIRAVQLLFLFTIAAGVLVLGAAFFSTRDERMHEVAILRVLGASSGQLSAALRIELVLIGGFAGLLAGAGAVSIAWVLADQ